MAPSFCTTVPNKSEHVRPPGPAYGLPVTVPETGPAEPSATPTSYLERVDPDELATTLKVLSQLHLLAPDHPDVRTVKHATGHMWKLIKKTRRAALRAERAAHDRAVVERTATLPAPLLARLERKAQKLQERFARKYAPGTDV